MTLRPAPLALLLTALALAPAFAQDGEEASATIGPDIYRAGETVTVGAAEADDVFLAGNTVSLSAPVSGSAHLAGRRLTVDAEVGRDVYAAGMTLRMAAPIAGDATLAGYDIEVTAEVGGDVRAAGTEVAVAAPVGGTAVLAGARLRLDAPVASDASLAGEEIVFGPEARVDGILRLYAEDVQAIEVPASVAPPDRVERFTAEEFETMEHMGAPSLGQVILGFLAGVVAVALIATVIAALVPGPLARMRGRALSRPFHTIWLGFLAISAQVGAALVLVLTVIGIFVSPAVMVLALLTGFIGYVVGAYSLGVGLLGAFGRTVPTTLAARSLAALTGALVAGLVALIPLLGWLFVLGLVLMGSGALIEALFRPRFFLAEEKT